MRRHSVVGPLILIALGLLLLFKNIYPDLRLMDFLAAYWPFLLIAWGVLRLIEVVGQALSARPVSANGISGGEWVLVFFFCVFGLTASAVGNMGTWWRNAGFHVNGIDILGESFEYPVSLSKKVSNKPKIVIESFRGNARIVGSDTDEVKVTGHKSIRSLEAKDAAKADQETPYELLVDGDHVTIRSNQERAGNLVVEADLEITVPKGSSVEARGRRGDFEVNDIDGAVEVYSDNAGVRVQNVGGDVHVDLRKSDTIRATNVRGMVELKGRGSDVELQDILGQVVVNGTYTGTLQFRNLSKPMRFQGPQTDLSIQRVPGQVRLALGNLTAENIQGPIRLESKSKDVRITGFTESLDIVLERGDVELRPGRVVPKISVRTTKSGDVELALPEAGRFNLRAATRRGEVTNDFGEVLKHEDEGRGASLSGVVGAGPAVNIVTERGSVTVRKSTSDEEASVAPEPEAPKAPKPIPASKAPNPPLKVQEQ